MQYGVKTAPGRYIIWCDDKWYETVKQDTRPFSTKEDALKAVQQLVEHFQYHVVLISEEGEQPYDFGKPTTQVPVPTEYLTADCEEGDFFLL